VECTAHHEIARCDCAGWSRPRGWFTEFHQATCIASGPRRARSSRSTCRVRLSSAGGLARPPRSRKECGVIGGGGHAPVHQVWWPRSPGRELEWLERSGTSHLLFCRWKRLAELVGWMKRRKPGMRYGHEMGEGSASRHALEPPLLSRSGWELRRSVGGSCNPSTVARGGDSVTLQ
jgi:hypothetical protein